MAYSPQRAPMSIPIPYTNDRSPGSRPLPSPSSSRSPSQSSLSSYRAHPYRPNLSAYSEDRDRDRGDRERDALARGGDRLGLDRAGERERERERFLPPPNSGSALHVLHERDDRDRRPSLSRTLSDGRYSSGSGGFQLPSFASLSASASSNSSPSTYPNPVTPTTTVMGPPILPQGSPGSSRPASPKMYAHSLRPSYYDAAPPARGAALGLSCYRGERERNGDPSPPRYERTSPYERVSPPLRSVNDYGRGRSHSAASAMPRYAAPATPAEDAPPGQSRRLAHLMSEQKRRESINTGFQSLRAALPSSIPTDSKAIILRKAVGYITQLEGLLRKHGIVEDVEMTQATGAVNALKMDTTKGWEEVHVEDIDVETKPDVSA